MEPPVQGNQDSGAQVAPEDMAVERKAVSLEIIGEMILLSAVAGFFIYIAVSARNWPFAAILTPAIAITIGTPFLIWRIVHVIRMGLWVHNTEVTQSQIMDIGFRVGQDRKGERQRFIRIFVAIGVLYGGIWILGFHITLPLWIFGYMYWFGKVRLVWAALIGLLFLGFIVGIYDMLLGAYWNEPLLLQWLK
jgi:ABC-type amino acid transport system permease subunit